jgi:uncharacterized alpha-E superfamily protein
MSRYLERAEHTARIVGVQLNLMLDQSEVSDADRWQRILASLGDPAVPSTDNLTRALLFDAGCKSSIVSCVNLARENCRQVRNQVSSEMWEQLNRLYHDVSRLGAARSPQALEFLAAADEGVHLFDGITDSTMSHNEGWQLIQTGKFLERTINTSALLNVHFRDMASQHHWEWVGLLKSCTAFEAYCREYTAELKPARIAQFLLLDGDFPHAVGFACSRVHTALGSLPGADGMGVKATRIAGRLHSSLRYLHIEEIMAEGIHRHLEDVRRECMQIHSALQEAYIDYPIDAALTR